MATSESEAVEKTKVVLSGLRLLSQVLDLDGAGMIALLNRVAGFEEPACEHPARC